MDSTTTFKQKVIGVVSKIPYGSVASYGQVALYCGAPRAAREVGWTLNRMENIDEVPWWRVVNNTGRITIKGSSFSADMQRKLLRSEGLIISDDFTFDIEHYRWKPDSSFTTLSSSSSNS